VAGPVAGSLVAVILIMVVLIGYVYYRRRYNHILTLYTELFK